MSEESEGQDVASVLLSFRAENIRSFRDELQLSLLATAVAEKENVRQVRWREGGQTLDVLPVACLFGANASGKTSVLKAMDDMRSHVLWSFRSGRPSGGVPRKYFLLDPSAAQEPSRFEVDLVVEDVRWEYGFEFDDDRVIEEWAYRSPHGRASLVFHREGDDVRLGASDRSRSRAVLDLLRPNALFLSTAASANHPTLLTLYAWFERNFLLAEADSRPYRQALTTEMLGDPVKKRQVLALLQAADLGVTGANKYEPDPVMRERMRKAVQILVGAEGDADASDDGPAFEQLGVRLTHRDADGAHIELEAEDESLGTRVWFGLVGPVIHALANGSVLLADELDASLHPDLVREVVRLFQDRATNPRRAQLVFNTHDATLLGDSASSRPLGRDQVWFTEKLDDGSTRLYPLIDLDPRKEEAIGRRYLAGRYGATPILSRQEFDAAAELISAGDRD